MWRATNRRHSQESVIIGLCRWLPSAYGRRHTRPATWRLLEGLYAEGQDVSISGDPRPLGMLYTDNFLVGI